jgi:hypothetical protein
MKKSKRKKSGKTRNSSSLKSESVKNEETKWIIPKSSFRINSHAHESKFIFKLESISKDNFKIRFLIQKLKKKYNQSRQKG